MAYCPNISDEQVVKDFNSIVEHFGGKPISQEEFRDPELRDSRIGIDRDAMQSAYYLWDKYAGDVNLVKLDANYSKQTKEGVDFVFEQNPELAKIGTLKQYSQYLDTIFPDSKVKDIVYRGDETKFDAFTTNTKNRTSGTSQIKKGFYFSTDRRTALTYKVSRYLINKNSLEKLLDVIEKSLGLKEYGKSYDIDEEGRSYVDYDETWNGTYSKPSDVIKKIESEYKRKISSSDLWGFGEEWYYGNYSSITNLKKDKNLDVDSLLNSMRNDDINNIRNIINTYISKYEDESTFSSALLNIKNPLILGNKEETNSVYKLLKGNEEKANDSTSIILQNVNDSIGGDEHIVGDTVVVFEPEQIHILSSKKDLEMFKNFINFTKSEYAKYGDIQQFKDYIMSKNFAAIEEFLVVNNKIDRKC